MIKQRRDSIEAVHQRQPSGVGRHRGRRDCGDRGVPAKALDEAGLLALVAEAVAEVAAASGQKPTQKRWAR